MPIVAAFDLWVDVTNSCPNQIEIYTRKKQTDDLINRLRTTESLLVRKYVVKVIVKVITSDNKEVRRRPKNRMREQFKCTVSY